jgi:hypothetical protein
MDIDALMDFCAAAGALDGNAALEHIRRDHGVPLSLCAGEMDPGKKERSTVWTPEEDAFLEENLRTMTIEEIGAALGRSEKAVKVHQIRRQITSASKRPGYLTGNKVARLFRVDIHAVMAWSKRGILETDILPGERKIMSVSIRRVYRWATRWQNWIYFKAERIRDPHLRSLVLRAQSLWDDEWWTPGQVAEYHGLPDTSLVNLHALKGTLKGVQWGNWHFLRSEAVRHIFYTGKGRPDAYKLDWSPGADAWIRRAREELSLTYAETAARMKGDWNGKRVAYRYRCLKEMQ